MNKERGQKLNAPLKFGDKKFQCPHCHVLAQQVWLTSSNANERVCTDILHFYLEYRTHIAHYSQDTLSAFVKELNNEIIRNSNFLIPSSFALAFCTSCKDISLWINKNVVYPKTPSVDSPNEDLDDEIKNLYHEASNILIDSPRGSAALLRLALQKLLIQLGKKGKNINDDIKELVVDGLSPKIQQALDLVRVVGNNAVHPGEINLDDNNEIAYKLFTILNFIANEMITKPKEIESLYDTIIPENTQKHIKERDNK